MNGALLRKHIIIIIVFCVEVICVVPKTSIRMKIIYLRSASLDKTFRDWLVYVSQSD